MKSVREKPERLLMLIVVAVCVIMTIIDGYLHLNYAVKSMVKIVMFLLLPVLFTKIAQDKGFFSTLKPQRKGMVLALILGLGVFVFLLVGYTFVSRFIDATQIIPALEKNMGIRGDNFIYVATYIAFINSFLEEVFFRGFAFLTLKKYTSRAFACWFSAVTFAVYHLAMMVEWFHWVVYLLIFLGLIVAGAIFNLLNEKYETIYNSWMVHMFANFAINTLGFIMFGIF